MYSIKLSSFINYTPFKITTILWLSIPVLCNTSVVPVYFLHSSLCLWCYTLDTGYF